MHRGVIKVKEKRNANLT